MTPRQLTIDDLLNDIFFKILNFLDEGHVNNLLTLSKGMAKRIQHYRNYALYHINYSSLKKAPTYHDKLEVIRSFNFFNRDYHLLKITSEAANKLIKNDNDRYKKGIEFSDDNIPSYTNASGKKSKDVVTLDALLLKGGDGENFIFKNRTNQILLDRLFQYFNDKPLPDKLNQLHLCVIFNQIDLVKQNQKDFMEMIHSVESDEGKASLNMAAIYGYVGWVPLLIEMGADVNQSNRLGQTSILLAARYGHEYIVQLLIENGADFHFPDGTNSTPLHWAAKNNHAAIVSLLINKGAHIQAKGTYHKAPIHFAAENGSPHAFNALIDGNETQLKLKDRDDNEPIHLAAKAGQESIIHIVANMGLKNLLIKNAYDKTPLELAWQNQQIKSVVGLLSYHVISLDDINSLILKYKTISTNFIIKLILELESRNNDNLNNWVHFFKKHIIEMFTQYINRISKEAASYKGHDLLSSERKAATHYCWTKIAFILESKKSINLIFDAVSYFFHMVSLLELRKANIHYDGEEKLNWPELFLPYYKAMVSKADQEEQKNNAILRLT